ncbi:MAG TPA: hypothetical protein VF371_06760, partial [Candidatus Limnocylindrales bacterium]
SASASPSATATVAQPSATPTPGASPTAGASAATFTTAGAVSNWQGFTWTTLPPDSPILTAIPRIQVIPWRGGYVAYGTTNGGSIGVVWTSADGETWRQVTDIVAPFILMAVSPTGLVAIAEDLSAASPTATVWTSTDGLAWHKAGTASGIGSIDSIAGTSAGLVATGHTVDGTGKFATSQFGVAFSTDGLNWTPVSIQPGLTWSQDYGPEVQSGNGRFFLMGGYTGGTASDARPLLASLTQPGRYGSGILGATIRTGGLWWSDDGRTWTRSSDTAYVAGLDFGQGGIVMHTTEGLVPGGTGLELSTDGGKSWRKSNDPLGAVVCGPRECSTGPDGVISSNGTFFVAVKSNGKAWISYDGQAWTSIGWAGPLSSLSLLVLPRGVVSDGQYGAAK